MKHTFLLDSGHGGMVNGKYVTPGKRSPIWKDGTQLFEGVFNRDLAKRIISLATAEGVKCVDLVNSQKDVPLEERVQKANALYKTDKTCVYVSVHGDAAGAGVVDHQATGISVFTSPGQTNSDKFAELMFKEFEKLFGATTKMRNDMQDGDHDWEANFYVLTKTLMPAVLVENGFMTNSVECKKMMTDTYKNQLARSYVNAFKLWDETN